MLLVSWFRPAWHTTIATQDMRWTTSWLIQRKNSEQILTSPLTILNFPGREPPFLWSLLPRIAFYAIKKTQWGAFWMTDEVRNSSFLKKKKTRLLVLLLVYKANTQNQVLCWELHSESSEITIEIEISRLSRVISIASDKTLSAASTDRRAGNQERQKPLSHRLTSFDRCPLPQQTSLLLLYCFSRSEGRRTCK